MILAPLVIKFETREHAFQYAQSATNMLDDLELAWDGSLLVCIMGCHDLELRRDLIEAAASVHGVECPERLQ